MKEENVFKQKLFNHTLPVREGLWESIETRLPPRKDERRFPLFWFVLFSSAILGGALMLSRISSNPFSSPAPIESFTLQKTNDHQESAINQPTPLIQSSSTDHLQVSGTPVTNVLSAKTFARNSFTSLSASSVIQETGPDEGEAQRNMIESPVFYSSGTSSLVPLLSLSEVRSSVGSDHTIDIDAISHDPNCYKFSGSGSWSYAFSADLFAGPGYSPRSFEETDSESMMYAQARKSTERNQYAWSAGARVNLHLRNGLGASLGMLYEQTGDIFDYMDSLAFQTSTRFDSFFASNGTFLYVDTVRVQINGTRIKKIHNTYRHLDIPILIGYELPMGRSKLMINAGPVINLTSWHKGQILDLTLHPQNITPGSPRELKAYQTNLGLSLYFGAGALLPLSDRLSALIEPRLLFRLKPVTLDSYSLKEHRHFTGINLGIRYHLN